MKVLGDCELVNSSRFCLFAFAPGMPQRDRVAEFRVRKCAVLTGLFWFRTFGSEWLKTSEVTVINVWKIFLHLWILLGGLRKSFFDHWELALSAPVLVGLPELVDHILGVALLAASSHIFWGLT